MTTAMTSLTDTARMTMVRPVVIDRNRDVVTGRFAPKAAKWGVTTVRLANGRIGYRLGTDGFIFANRSSAVSRAMAVRPSIVHTGAIKRLVGPTEAAEDARMDRLVATFEARAEYKPLTTATMAKAPATFGEGIFNAYDSAWLDKRDARRAYNAIANALGEHSPEASAAWRAFRAAEDRFAVVYRAEKVREAEARGGSYDARTGGTYTGD